MNDKFEIKEIDGIEVLEKNTPIPQYGEGICKIETVITKEAFLLCYNTWVKGRRVDMNVLPKDEDGIVIEPCIDCKHCYVEDIWYDFMCDKPKIEDGNYNNCPYYMSEE